MSFGIFGIRAPKKGCADHTNLMFRLQGGGGDLDLRLANVM